MEEVATQQQINKPITEPITEDKQYDEIIQKLQEAKENGLPIEEGILGAITGGLLGATVGPSVMKAICKILGVDERGQFGSLLTSRMMTTALGAAMGWK